MAAKTTGRHVIKSVIDGKEVITKGVHNRLTVLDSIATNNRGSVKFIYAWKYDADDRVTRRYRYMPNIGWQMLDTKNRKWK